MRRNVCKWSEQLNLPRKASYGLKRNEWKMSYCDNCGADRFLWMSLVVCPFLIFFYSVHPNLVISTPGARVLPRLCKVCPQISKSAPTFKKTAPIFAPALKCLPWQDLIEPCHVLQTGSHRAHVGRQAGLLGIWYQRWWVPTQCSSRWALNWKKQTRI